MERSGDLFKWRNVEIHTQDSLTRKSRIAASVESCEHRVESCTSVSNQGDLRGCDYSTRFAKCVPEAS